MSERVIVAGGGPVGLSLALGLARHAGLDVTVVEREASAQWNPPDSFDQRVYALGGWEPPAAFEDFSPPPKQKTESTKIGRSPLLAPRR